MKQNFKLMIMMFCSREILSQQNKFCLSGDESLHKYHVSWIKDNFIYHLYLASNHRKVKLFRKVNIERKTNVSTTFPVIIDTIHRISLSYFESSQKYRYYSFCVQCLHKIELHYWYLSTVSGKTSVSYFESSFYTTWK